MCENWQLCDRYNTDTSKQSNTNMIIWLNAISAHFPSSHNSGSCMGVSLTCKLL